MNTNSAYAAARFGELEAQQPDTSYAYVNVIAEGNFI